MSLVAEAPLLFISTHLDDIALSCGHFMGANPGATVATVCAFGPNAPADGWDRDTTGKATGHEAIEVRRAEDAAAMAVLEAEPVWLHFADLQYAGPLQLLAAVRRFLADPGLRRSARAAPSPERAMAATSAVSRSGAVREIAKAIDQVLGVRFRTLFAPLGVMHPDHAAVSDACLTLATDRELLLYCYLDMPYGREHPELVDARLEAIRSEGYSLSDPIVVEPVDLDVKRRAVECYRSQLDQLRQAFVSFETSLTDSECYWRVEPPPCG